MNLPADFFECRFQATGDGALLELSTFYTNFSTKPTMYNPCYCLPNLQIVRNCKVNKKTLQIYVCLFHVYKVAKGSILPSRTTFQREVSH